MTSFIKTLLWPFFQDKKPAPTPPHIDVTKTGPTGPAGVIVEGAKGVPATQWATGATGMIARDIPGVTRMTRPSDFGPPPFQPLVSNDDRRKIFGHFSYRDDPIAGNPEHIRITDNWQRENIIWVPIPQLRGIPGAEVRDGRVGMEFHRKGAVQLARLWRDWEDAGLLHLILTFEGSFVSRYVRGSRTNLSNHCFGNAFDINYEWNKLGHIPGDIGALGSVRELIPIASANGFFWGGFYHGRQDGMHFELAKVET